MGFDDDIKSEMSSHPLQGVSRMSKGIQKETYGKQLASLVNSLSINIIIPESDVVVPSESELGDMSWIMGSSVTKEEYVQSWLAQFSTGEESVYFDTGSKVKLFTPSVSNPTDRTDIESKIIFETQ